MKFLSDAFLEAWLSEDRTPMGTATGSITLLTTGGPDGKTATTFDLRDGVVVAATPGATKGADIELSAPYALVADLFCHRADPAVAFMQGGLKMSGDMAMWLDVLPGLQARLREPGASAAAREAAF